MYVNGVHMHAYVCVHVCEGQGQLLGEYLLLSCGFQGLNSGNEISGKHLDSLSHLTDSTFF